MDGLCKIYLPYYLILLVCVSKLRLESYRKYRDSEAGKYNSGAGEGQPREILGSEAASKNIAAQDVVEYGERGNTTLNNGGSTTSFHMPVQNSPSTLLCFGRNTIFFSSSIA